MAEPEPERSNATNSVEPSAEPVRAEVEPLPEWNTAIQEWGAFWQVHIYGLGTLFLLIALFSAFAISKLVYTTDIRRKKVHIVNLALLLMFSLTRSLFLLIDPYYSRKTLSIVAVKLLWGIGQPCLITAYVLIFIVLKNAFMMKQRFRRWYTIKNIALITLPYFFFVCAAEMTISFAHELIGFTFACQLLYVLFTVFLIIFYSFIASKIWKKKRDAEAGSIGRQYNGQSSKLRSILSICLAAISGGVLLCVSQIYAMAGVYGVFSSTRDVLPWPWFGFSTGQRLLEVYMCLLLCKMLLSKSNNDQQSGLSQNSSFVLPGHRGDVTVTRQVVVVTTRPLSPVPGSINDTKIEI